MSDREPALPDAPARLAAALLDWYDAHGRDLPWRAPAWRQPDPYRVWLSEIMLQQTTVAAVKPYFEAFLDRWPTVEALADAPSEAVMAAWAGLGYYARARNLHACAKAVAAAHGGVFPDSEDGLRALPGVGTYTAAAIAAIAFDRPAAVVDGNVERVIARLVDLDRPLPGAKRTVARLVAAMVPAGRPGDFAQATMDLGATVCTPRAPACGLCPWMRACRARAAGTVGDRPVKAARKARPQRHGVAFWLVRDGHVLLVRRPARGSAACSACPAPSGGRGRGRRRRRCGPRRLLADWQPLGAGVRHGFTHFELTLALWSGTASADAAIAPGDWVPLDRVLDAGLPSVMAKAARLALSGA
ncbi:MAG: A/G-specific adenine glycosylase [Alphaproteobacteria bacterium]